MRIHGISDIHLDAVTHGVRRFEEVKDVVFALLEDVQEGDIVVFNGDYADPGTNQSYEAVAQCIRFDQKAKERGARLVFWNIGNHDVLEDGSGGNVLLPLAATGARVVDSPSSVVTYDGTLMIFLPHAPLSRRYDPAAFLDEEFARLPDMTVKAVIVFGHLNPPGISPGSEASVMPRGRDVMWPWPLKEQKNVLYVGGHVHRAQVYRGKNQNEPPLHIVGSPVRFDFGEADHVPRSFIVEWDDKKGWKVTREEIAQKLAIRLFFDGYEDGMIRRQGRFGDFVRVEQGSEEALEAAKVEGLTVVPLPKIAAAQPRAKISEGARKHRRSRDVVLDVARAYETDGLVDRVEKTMTGEGL